MPLRTGNDQRDLKAIVDYLFDYGRRLQDHFNSEVKVVSDGQDTSIADNVTDIETNTAGIAANVVDIAANAAAIAALALRVTAAEATIVDHETRITALE